MSLVRRHSGNVSRFIGRAARSGVGALARRAFRSVRNRVSKRSGRRTPNRNNRKRKTSRGGAGSMADDHHSGIGQRRATITLNKRLKGRGLGTWKIAQNYALTITSTAGNQAAMELGGVCYLNQFISNAATPNGNEIKQNLFDLNYARAIGGSGLFPAQAVPATDRLCVYSIRSQMMFTNLESAATVMTIYVMTPVSDHSVLPLQSWNTFLGDEDLNVPLRGRSAPGAYGALANIGGGTPQDVFAKPTDLAGFRKQWRVLKVVKIRLAGGATEELDITYRINKVVDRAKILANGREAIKGLSVCLFATAYGQPVRDFTIGGPGPQNITTAATKVGMVQTNTFFCGMTAKVAASRLDSYVTNQQITSGVPFIDQHMVDVEDDVTSVVQA